MINNTNWVNRVCCITLVAGVLALAGTGAALADPKGRDYRDYRDDRGSHRNDRRDYRDERRDRDYRKDQRVERRDRDYRKDQRVERRDRDYTKDQRVERRDYRDERRDRDYRYEPRRRYEGGYRDYRWTPRVFHRGIPRDRVRRYRDIIILRPYGHLYPGYAHYYHDDDAYKWLAFTAITLGVLNYLNEAQQREHEAAQIAATMAPIGERIIWQEGGASGSVVAIRDGTSTTGRYCREFMHEVSIGGRAEQAYGTACRNPDGSWEVLSIDNP